MKQVIALALAAAFSFPALAGDHGGSGRHMDRVTQELNLNDKQAAEVKQIMQEQREKGRALWDQAAGDKEKMRGQMDALHQETMTRLGKVLNADQMAKMQKMHEERMANWKDRRGDREDVLDDLALSGDQETQVKQIMKEQHEKKRTLWQAEGDRASKRPQMEALHAETRTRLATVLNEEQLAKFDAAHQARMEKRKPFRGHGPDGEEKDDDKEETEQTEPATD